MDEIIIFPERQNGEKRMNQPEQESGARQTSILIIYTYYITYIILVLI